MSNQPFARPFGPFGPFGESVLVLAERERVQSRLLQPRSRGRRFRESPRVGDNETNGRY